jgi:hypothetical protein
MTARLYCAAIVGLIGTALFAADDERKLRIVASRAIPAIESVSIYHMKDEKRQAIAELTKFDALASLPNEGPFEVFAKPKEGISVRVADKLLLKNRETQQFKLADYLGSVEVIGDSLPRAEKIVLTDERDPGPGEKGHVAVQIATAYRIEMVAPAGYYSVWIVPNNGAKAQRIAERVRVLAGKSIRIGD